MPAELTPGPPGWLVAYSVGPVADFVATARKMRDLWFGSHMLSEISLAAMRRASELRAEAIFPQRSATAAGDADAAGLPNRAVLWLPRDAPVDPPALLCEIEKASRAALRSLASDALGQFIGGLRHPGKVIDIGLFHLQIDHLLEFHSAWVTCDDPAADANFRQSYRQLQRLVLASKRTRPFGQQPGQDAGYVKSALDAARPSVLRREYLDSRWSDHQRRFGIEGDALDAAGLVKRVLGADRRFPALTRVALDPWIRALTDDPLDSLANKYEAVRQAGWATASAPHDRFGYDAQLLLADRLRLEIGRAKEEGNEAAERAMKELGAVLGTCIASSGQPDPYVAFVALDIDRFGARLWDAGREGQQALARLAADFAAEVSRIARARHGCVLYAGGDEALVIVPVRAALACASECAAALRRLCRERGRTDADEVTLSAGVLMAHALTPLAQLRRGALDALALAKRGTDPCEGRRDAIAVVAQPRSGGPIVARGRWGRLVPGDDMPARLHEWVGALQDRSLPMGAAGIVDDAFGLCGADRQLLRAALARFVRRRTAARGQPWVALAGRMLEDRLQDRVGVAACAARLREELRLARWLREHGVERADFAPAAQQPAREAA